MDQLLREWPPGYGGVERVAHELASELNVFVYSFDVQSHSLSGFDSLPVSYSRIRLPAFNIFGRLYLPIPSKALFRLLFSRRPLHGHLPSPAVLFVLILAKIIRPSRHISAHWHCFLDPDTGLTGFLYFVYQHLALYLLPFLSLVVTTSPLLAHELECCGLPPARIFTLPCCLSQQLEKSCLALPFPDVRYGQPLRLLFIGRLDTYKRLDWLLIALSELNTPFQLTVVGDGPYRSRFQNLALATFPLGSPVRFLGRLTEDEKLKQLSDSDVLVLPSDRSNEAFGIVQLEAMAAGRISLAFDHPRSGMGWVAQLPGLPWSQSREGLVEVLVRLAQNPSLRYQLSLQSRDRYLTLFARDIWLNQLDRLVASAETGNV